MITYLWREALEEDEAREIDELVDEAAEFDAEAGFSTAVPAADGTAATRHLVVTIAPRGERGSAELDRLPDVRVVAYLRLDVADGVGHVQFLVRPAFRSHGVATLLVEQLDEQTGGWAAIPGLRELRAWAHGDHPAAERMAGRLGARVEHGVFKTLRFVGGSRPFTGPAVDVERAAASEGPAEVVGGHRAAMAPGERAVLARALTRLVAVHGDGSVLVGVDEKDPAGQPACVAPEPAGLGAAALRPLLTQGLLDVQGAGARVAQLYVDAMRDDLVQVSRELGFEHDHSDLLYVLARLPK